MTSAFRKHYLGFRFIRYFCVSYIIMVHSFVWINLSLQKNFALNNETLFGKLFIWGSLFPMMLPCIAGASFCIEEYKDRFQFSLKKGTENFLFLYLLNTVFFVLNYGFDYLLSWDILPLVGITLFIISLIPDRLRIYVIPILISLLFISSSTIKAMLTPYFLTDVNFKIEDAKYIYTLLIGVTLLLNATFWRLRSDNLLLKILLITYNILVVLFFVSDKTNQSLVFMHNFPASTLVADPMSFHVWPIFNWMGAILFGYWLFDLFHRIDSILKIRISLLLGVVILVAIPLLTRGYSEYMNSLNNVLLWGHGLYNLSYWAIFLVWAAFVGHLLANELFESHFVQKLDFVTEMGAFVLWIYLFMNSIIVVKLPYFFNSLIPTPYSYVFYAFVLHIVIYKVSHWFFHKKIRIKLRKS